MMENRELFDAMEKREHVYFAAADQNVYECKINKITHNHPVIILFETGCHRRSDSSGFFKTRKEAEASLLPVMPKCIDCPSEMEVVSDANEYFLRCSVHGDKHTVGRYMPTIKEAIEMYSKLAYKTE